MQEPFEVTIPVAKVDRGLVFGYAIVCKQDGKPHFDRQNEHVPEDVMLDMATDFMANSRVAKSMHEGDPIGDVLYALPLTTELAKALGLETQKTGLIIGMRPSAEHLAKFENGDYTGFSIGGFASYEDVTDG